jgi:hypothetical protein
MASTEDSRQVEEAGVHFRSSHRPTVPKSTVLSIEQEAIVVAFCEHTVLPLDDGLYALRATVPQIIRSSLQRCLKRSGISRLATGLTLP